MILANIQSQYKYLKKFTIMATKKILLNEDKFAENIKNRITQNSSNLETVKQELFDKHTVMHCSQNMR